MKKTFRSIITIICLISVSSVYGQWTTSGSNVGLTTPANNVIVGPTPTTPTNLHVNSNTAVGSSSTTLVTIENTGAAISKGAYLIFKNGGVSYSMGTNSFPGAESGMFHITNVIHTNGSQVTFSDGFSRAYTGVYATAKYCFRNGLSAFDSSYASKAGVNMYAPKGYNFGVYGNSYFQNKVVIGTASTTLPTSAYKLYVGGTAICEELIVKVQASWPDFVFAPNYKLMSLNQVKNYIAENNHLPGVPAACEVEENGVAAGEMLTIQMQKIEELTLYMIQMQEQNEAIMNANARMQKENNDLKKRIESLETK